jgi:hypothetical protein
MNVPAPPTAATGYWNQASSATARLIAPPTAIARQDIFPIPKTQDTAKQLKSAAMAFSKEQSNVSLASIA